MPLRSLGYALDESTLKQVAFNHGITDSLTNMSQAQKSQIRYLAIMEQSKNAMGDMARTLESPANQMRIFEQRIDQLKRAIGNGLMPIISAALPWVTAFVKLLTEGAQKIADFLGFEIPKFDYGALIADSNKGVSSSFDSATKAAKEFKGTLSSIDQLNIIGGEKDTGSTGLGNMYDLNIDLPSYDFLGGLEESTDKAYNSLKNFVNNALPWLESFGTGIAIAFGTSKIGGFITSIGNLYDGMKKFIGLNGAKTFTGIAGGLAAGATSGMLLFNGIKNLVTKTGDLANNFNLVKAGVGVAGIALSAFIAMGNPVGAVITGVVAGLGALAGVIVGNIENMKAFDDALNNSITYASNGGARLSGLTDGFKSYFSEITGHYDDILANTKAFEDNESKISSAATEINNLTGKYLTLGESMTAEDAAALVSNLETIEKGVSDSLGIGTQGIVNSLKNTFHTFAEQLGIDVDEMAGKFYLLESMGNASLASIKKEADELALKISESTEADPTDLERLTELTEKMTTPNIGTKEQLGFNAMLEDMSSGRIQFENADQAISSINDFKVAAEQAKESINSAFLDQSYELQQMKARYISLGIDVEYDALYGSGAFEQLFSDYEQIAKETQQSELDKIDMGVMVYVSMLESQLEKNAAQYANTKIGEVGPGFGSGIKAFFTRGGLAMDDTAMYLQAMEDYSEEYRALNSDLYNAVNDALGGLNLNPEAEKIGGYLLEGMANGAIKNTDNLYEALSAAATGGIDEVKRICGIASPSKVFYGIGEYLVEGLRLGVQSEESATLREFEAFGKDINSAIVIAPLDWGVLMGETPETDFSKVYTPKSNYSYYAQSSEPVRTEGYDVASVMEVAQLMTSAQDGAGIEFTIYTNVELDGETVGEAVSRRQDYTMRLSNGR